MFFVKNPCCCEGDGGDGTCPCTVDEFTPPHPDGDLEARYTIVGGPFSEGAGVLTTDDPGRLYKDRIGVPSTGVSGGIEAVLGTNGSRFGIFYGKDTDLVKVIKDTTSNETVLTIIENGTETVAQSFPVLANEVSIMLRGHEGDWEVTVKFDGNVVYTDEGIFLTFGGLVTRAGVIAESGGGEWELLRVCGCPSSEAFCGTVVGCEGHEDKDCYYPAVITYSPEIFPMPQHFVDHGCTYDVEIILAGIVRTTGGGGAASFCEGGSYGVVWGGLAHFTCEEAPWALPPKGGTMLITYADNGVTAAYSSIDGCFICGMTYHGFIPGGPTLDCDGTFSGGDRPITVEPTCEGCTCRPSIDNDVNSIDITLAWDGGSIVFCVPVDECGGVHPVLYEGDIAGCPDSALEAGFRCESDGTNYRWVVELTNAATEESQIFPVSLDGELNGTVSGTLTVLCASTPVDVSVSSPASCPICEPVFASAGAMKLFGTLGGHAFEVCLFGPIGLSSTGSWAGGILQFEGGPCDGANLLFEVYCKELTGGASEWVLEITNGVESAELPIEWFDPLSAQGDVSGPVDLCGETGLAFAAAIAMFTEVDDPGHPFMRCCDPDIVQQCDLPKQLMADATPVPFQFDPCSVSNCDGILRTMALIDTPLECNGNPIGLTGYSPGDKYFISDFPATTHPVPGADAFNGHKLLVWCDGSNMRWARLDEDGCVYLNETGGFATWDCESFSGTIEYNFEGSQDCCDGFGLTRWDIEVAPNL